MAATYSTGYTIGFAAAVCGVCSIFVAGSAVSLREKQETNKILDRYEKVLTVAGLLESDETLSEAQITQRFEENIRARVVELETGEYAENIDAKGYDQRSASKDPAQSEAAPPNKAKVLRLPKHALVYQVMDGEKVAKLVLPIEGKGLWSTLYGFMAVDADGQTVRGITYYEHGETPGLGGEVDNPKWKARWPGRKIYDDKGDVELQVIKGQAGSVEETPYKVDGLSGATLTSQGVTNMVQLWFGPDGFKPYLENFRKTEGSAQ